MAIAGAKAHRVFLPVSNVEAVKSLRQLAGMRGVYEPGRVALYRQMATAVEKDDKRAGERLWKQLVKDNPMDGWINDYRGWLDYGKFSDVRYEETGMFTKAVVNVLEGADPLDEIDAHMALGRRESSSSKVESAYTKLRNVVFEMLGSGSKVNPVLRPLYHLWKEFDSAWADYGDITPRNPDPLIRVLDEMDRVVARLTKVGVVARNTRYGTASSNFERAVQQ